VYCLFISFVTLLLSHHLVNVYYTLVTSVCCISSISHFVYINGSDSFVCLALGRGGGGGILTLLPLHTWLTQTFHASTSYCIQSTSTPVIRDNRVYLSSQVHCSADKCVTLNVNEWRLSLTDSTLLTDHWALCRYGIPFYPITSMRYRFNAII